MGAASARCCATQCWLQLAGRRGLAGCGRPGRQRAGAQLPTAPPCAPCARPCPQDKDAEPQDPLAAAFEASAKALADRLAEEKLALEERISRHIARWTQDWEQVRAPRSHSAGPGLRRPGLPAAGQCTCGQCTCGQCTCGQCTCGQCTCGQCTCGQCTPGHHARHLLPPQDLEGRPEEVKASGPGRQATLTFKQTKANFEPLHRRLKLRQIGPEMRAGLWMMVESMRDRNYLAAYDVYLR
jgi:hypothetical protein